MHKMNFPKSQLGSAGSVMVIAAWILILGLLTYTFHIWYQQQQNPNQQLEVRSHDGIKEIVLKQNRSGHYVVNGSINGKPMTFFIDTGATNVSIPEKLTKGTGLQRLATTRSETAAGVITVYLTRIDKLTIGPIELSDVRASINPASSSDEVLLGMSVLRQLEMQQTGEQLILRQR